MKTTGATKQAKPPGGKKNTNTHTHAPCDDGHVARRVAQRQHDAGALAADAGGALQEGRLGVVHEQEHAAVVVVGEIERDLAEARDAAGE